MRINVVFNLDSAEEMKRLAENLLVTKTEMQKLHLISEVRNLRKEKDRLEAKLRELSPILGKGGRTKKKVIVLEGTEQAEELSTEETEEIVTTRRRGAPIGEM